MIACRQSLAVDLDKSTFAIAPAAEGSQRFGREADVGRNGKADRKKEAVCQNRTDDRLSFGEVWREQR